MNLKGETMLNEIKTPKDIYSDVLIKIHRAALERNYITQDAIMVEEITDKGFEYSADWLDDEEFYATFKGNKVGYYLGLCVNCLCGGMVYADAWAYGGDTIDKIKYDEIYDGGVWNNIFVLLEMKGENNCKDFQNFIIEMYEKWVVLLKDYFKSDDANKYISTSLAAFFQLGVTLRLDILGY